MVRKLACLSDLLERPPRLAQHGQPSCSVDIHMPGERTHRIQTMVPRYGRSVSQDVSHRSTCRPARSCLPTCNQSRERGSSRVASSCRAPLSMGQAAILAELDRAGPDRLSEVPSPAEISAQNCSIPLIRSPEVSISSILSSRSTSFSLKTCVCGSNRVYRHNGNSMRQRLIKPPKSLVEGTGFIRDQGHESRHECRLPHYFPSLSLRKYSATASA